MSFKNFVISEAKQERFGRIEHLEDFIIEEGLEGFTLLKKALDGVIDFCNGKPTDVVVSQKIDGSPNITFGVNAEGKFWVGTKSLFNKKTPKINYTPEDINRNHESPGLNKKLNVALRYLPMIRAKGIVSADILFTEDDIKQQTIDNKKMLTFKANTLVYAAEVGTDIARKISVAKIGIAVHTKFEGDHPQNFKAQYNPAISFTPHQAVFVVNPYDVTVAPFNQQEMQELERLGSMQVDPKIFDIIRETKNAQMFKKYTNQLVRNGQIETDPKSFYNGLKQFFEVNDNRIFRHFDDELLSLCEAYLNIIKIKKMILNHLRDTEALRAFVKDGDSLVPVSGEGFVVVVDNLPIKLIDRSVFSRANFTQEKPWDQQPQQGTPQ